MRQTNNHFYIMVPLKRDEAEVLREFATEMDIPQEKVLIQALRVFQMYRQGLLVQVPDNKFGLGGVDD